MIMIKRYNLNLCLFWFMFAVVEFNYLIIIIFIDKHVLFVVL